MASAKHWFEFGVLALLALLYSLLDTRLVHVPDAPLSSSSVSLPEVVWLMSFPNSVREALDLCRRKNDRSSTVVTTSCIGNPLIFRDNRVQRIRYSMFKR